MDTYTAYLDVDIIQNTEFEPIEQTYDNTLMYQQQINKGDLHKRYPLVIHGMTRYIFITIIQCYSPGK